MNVLIASPIQFMKQIRENLDVIRIMIKKFGFSGLFELLKSDVLFDYRYGVDTYSAVSREELFTGERLALQNRYCPSTFALIDLAIKEAHALIGDEIRSCHLVDYGSGKGKVLIGAVKYGFPLARGIEFTERLHRIAVRNLEKLGLNSRAESIHGDATEFFPSPKDRVLYFFNPFEGVVLDQTLQNIKTIEPEGKRVLVVYNPVCDDIFCRYFERVAEKVSNPGQARYNVYVG
jgi:16S rRNA G966 N2-methylase RsmD